MTATTRALLRIRDEDGGEYPVRVYGSDVAEAKRNPVTFAMRLGFRRVIEAHVEAEPTTQHQEHDR